MAKRNSKKKHKSQRLGAENKFVKEQTEKKKLQFAENKMFRNKENVLKCQGTTRRNRIDGK